MSVAHVYAKALFQAATEGKSPAESAALCDQLDSQLATLLEVLETSKQLQVALQAPITTSKEKAAVVKELVAKLGFGRLMSDFLILLASKGRFLLLQPIRDEFASVRLTAEGGVPGRLSTAEAISPSDVENLAKAFSRKLGKKVAFQVKTDPSLLAGIKVTVNGVTYDGTLRSQLQQLRDRFLVGVASGN